MIKTTFNVVANFGAEIAQAANLIAREELQRASDFGAEQASSLAGGRRRTGEMAKFKAVQVIPTASGWRGGFRSDAGISGEFYSGFQSRGTLASRKRKVKQQTLNRRESPSGKARYAKVAGKKGITPLGHEEKARAQARAFLIANLNRRLGR